jgi:hypothetical protein
MTKTLLSRHGELFSLDKVPIYGCLPVGRDPALKGGAYGALAGEKLTTVGWGVNFGLRGLICLFMQSITRVGEYGLRGLLFLARQPSDRLFLVNEVSKAQKIPETYLAKIFQRLSKTGR